LVFTLALLVPAVLGTTPGCTSGTSSGGTAGATGSAGTGSPGAGGTTGPAGTTGAAGAAGSGGGICAPPTSSAGVSTVTGPAVGAGLVPNSAITKKLSVTDLSHNPMFTVTGAWLADVTNRRTLDQDTFAWGFVALTYHGSVPICTVQLTALTYRDAAGNAVNPIPGASPYVSVGYVQAGTGMQCAGLKQTFRACIAPGESAFAGDHVTFSGTTLATTTVVGVDFASITGYTNEADAQPDINVAVTGYTIDPAPDANSPQALHVTLKNTGTASVTLAASVPYYLLDDQGLPLYYGTISGNQVTGTLTVGQTVTVSDTDVGFDGASTRILFLPAFTRLVQ